jgi:hypothetical protein
MMLDPGRRSRSADRATLVTLMKILKERPGAAMA